MSPALASLVQRESAIDDVIRAGGLPAHDPLTRRLAEEVRHRQFPAATMLGMLDNFLRELREAIRNGRPFDEIKAMLGEDTPQERPGAMDRAIEMAGKDAPHG